MDATAQLLRDRPHTQIARLSIDRPERRNALDLRLVEALIEAFEGPLPAVTVLGATSKEAFCAGADTKVSDGERRRLSDRLYVLYAAMRRSTSVVVAAIDGFAIGAGAQLAIASDLRVASPAASFRFAGPGHGLTVGAWGLPSLVGRGRALELCLSMRAIGGEEAATIGLVDRLVEDVAGTALELARRFVELDLEALARTKRVIAAAVDESALAAERDGNRASWDGSI